MRAAPRWNRIRTPGVLFRLAIMLLFLVATPAVRGQANCSLRNPDRQIYEIFPEATSYRTVVAQIDARKKQDIESIVGSGLDRTDLGKHTAYLVLRDAVPLGFVHARTEVGARGSIELVWAMDLDLAIRDFRVQRSRERNTDAIKAQSFQARLIGRDLGDIKALLSEGNHDVNLAALGAPAGAASITRTVVLCALKTRVITDVAFGDSILAARMLGHIHRAFPGTSSVRRISEPLGGDLARAPDGADLGNPFPFEKTSITLLRSVKADDSAGGMLLFARWEEKPGRPETWWAVSPHGIIEEARVVGAIDDETRDAFRGLAGMDAGALAGGEGALPDEVRRCAEVALAIAERNG